MERTEITAVSDGICGDIVTKMDYTSPDTKEYQMMVKSYLDICESEVNMSLKEEQQKAEISKQKHEIAQGWAKIGVGLITTGLYVCTGIIMLKYNLSEGNIQGRDAGKWFDQLRTIIRN